MTEQINLDGEQIETASINVMRKLKEYPDLVKYLKRKPRRIIREANLRENREYYRSLAGDFNPLNGSEVLCGDFIEVCESIEDNSVDAIFTDPPYGREYLHLWEELSKVAERVLKPSGWLISLTGHICFVEQLNGLNTHLNYYHQFIRAFGAPLPFLRSRGINTAYRSVVVFYKPPMHMLRKNIPKDLLEKAKGDKSVHSWGQPVEETVEMLGIFTNEGDLILDPMAGGGTTPNACRQTNRRCISIDIDPENVAIIKGLLTVPFRKEKPLEK